jgi:hypothetical protein
MKATIFSRMACALVVTGLLSMLGAAAAEIQVTGVWKWTSQGRDGQTRENSMNLVQEGNKITGTVSGRTEPRPITEGKLEGDKLLLKVRRESERGIFTANYTGKVTGNKVTGEIQMQFGEREFTREWTATLVDANPTGTWLWNMERPDGQAWEATMKIEKADDKLIGSFGREDSDWTIPIRNLKVQGSVLTFETVFEWDGQSMTIKNKALITGKTMKGQSVREEAEGGEPREWKAVRQP